MKIIILIMFLTLSSCANGICHADNGASMIIDYEICGGM